MIEIWGGRGKELIYGTLKIIQPHLDLQIQDGRCEFKIYIRILVLDL